MYMELREGMRFTTDTFMMCVLIFSMTWLKWQLRKLGLNRCVPDPPIEVNLK